MRRALDHAMRAFEGRARRANRRRRQRAQQDAAVAPVDVRLHIEATPVGGQAQVWVTREAR